VGFEVWIAIVLFASGLSGWIGFAYARKDVPKQSELDALAAELEEARSQAETVQSDVSEHFEQSALLFGKLAADYREFLDHFSASAQNLGLSESRARELLEQGFQPLLTHEAAAESVVADTAATPSEAATEQAESEQAESKQAESEPEGEQAESPSRASDVTVEMPESEAADTVKMADSTEASSDPTLPGDTAADEADDAGRQRAS